MSSAPTSASISRHKGSNELNKKKVINRIDWRKWLLSFLAALVLSLMSLTEALKLPELLIYDWLVSITYPLDQDNHIVMVELDDRQENSDIFNEALMKQLTALNPAEILLIDKFDASVAHAYLRDHQHVTVVPEVRLVHEDGHRTSFQLKPDANTAMNAKAGYLLPLLPEYGITRSIIPFVESRQGALPAFQTLSAERYFADKGRQRDIIPATRQPIYINYNNGTPVLPRYPAASIAKGHFDQQLFANKVVLLIPPVNSLDTVYTIPFRHYAEPVSAFHVQAQALNTLINRSAIVHFSPGYSALLSCVVFFIYVFVFQWQNVRLNTLTIGLTGLFTLFISWLMLSLLYLYIPLFQLGICLLLAYFIAHRFSRRSESDLFVHVQLDLLSRLRAKKVQQSFYLSDDPWRQLIVFISQHLLLERSILMQRVSNDHRLKEIKSLGCSLDDIEERRRDYHRFPYSQSLQQELPLDLSDRAYFKNLAPGEQQFLVPLLFADEVLGFWAFTVKPEANWDRGLFMANIMAFSRQISLLLHNRDAFEAQQHVNQKLSTRLLSFNTESSKQQALKSAVAGIEHRLNIMEGIFDGMSTAAILYDLFGQVMSSNQLMDKLAREAGLAIYEATSLDLMMGVTGLSAKEARSRLRYVVMNMASVDLPLSDLIENRHYLLHISPIKWEPHERFTGTDETRPFELLGVLFEFVNVTPIQRRFSTDRAAYESLFSTLRNDFSSLSMCQLQLSMDPQQPSEILTHMGNALERSTEVIKRVERLLHDATENNTKGGKLLHPLLLLKRSLNQVNDKIKETKLHISRQLPNFTGLVFVGESELETMLTQSLLLLIGDAVPESTIHVTVHQRPAEDYEDHQGRIVIVLENTGYGMPQKELDARREDSSFIKSDAIALLKNAIHGVFLWQVEVKLSSEVGKGFEIEINLPVINFLNTEEVL